MSPNYAPPVIEVNMGGFAFTTAEAMETVRERLTDGLGLQCRIMQADRALEDWLHDRYESQEPVSCQFTRADPPMVPADYLVEIQTWGPILFSGSERIGTYVEIEAIEGPITRDS